MLKVTHKLADGISTSYSEERTVTLYSSKEYTTKKVSLLLIIANSIEAHQTYCKNTTRYKETSSSLTLNS